MNSFLQYVDDFFKKQGILEKSFSNFEYRVNQHKMAIDIANTFEKGGITIIEAGTGIGKTFAYLLPAILSSKKVVVATKSKNLQEQLYFKDIETLKKIIPFNIKAIYIKGRSNYICLDKLSKISISNVFFKNDTLNNINKWVKNTKYGDISELKEDIYNPLINSITSSSDTCKGAKCKFFKDCFVYNLKLEAEKSDIIIVNYHLLFADLKVKNQGFGKVLPEFKYLVCDEAHSIEEIATEYFGDSISKYQMLHFFRELEINNFTEAEKFKNSFEEFFIEISTHLKDNSRVDIKDIINKKIEEKGDNLLSVSKELNYKLKDSKNDNLEILAIKLDKFINILDDILFAKDEFNIKWVEKSNKNILLKCFPVDVSYDLGEFFYNLKSVIFTSATLSVNNKFEFFKKRVGIEFTDIEAIYPSPFNYKKQAILYIPKRFEQPNSTNFINLFLKELKELIKITKGNAFVLFTNLKNMKIVGEQLKESCDFSILIQGETSNLDMINRFKTERNSVLLGSYSFWEGIDIPGDSLSLVVIEKLPFAVPSDPLKRARIEKIKEEAGNPFFEYQIPEAVMLLKQGIGRLIRNKQDKGIIAIFDIRLLTKHYGKIFLKNLPDMEIYHNLDIIREKYKGLKE